jgi:hypothetical protein
MAPTPTALPKPPSVTFCPWKAEPSKYDVAPPAIPPAAPPTAAAPLTEAPAAPAAAPAQDATPIVTAAATAPTIAAPAARLGRDRLANLADELDRALVEADYRPVGIGRLGIKVEHVFHAGDVFAVAARQ